MNNQIQNPCKDFSNKEFLTVKEAAIFLGCSLSHVYKLTHERRVNYSKPNGKSIYFKRENLVEYALQNEVEKY